MGNKSTWYPGTVLISIDKYTSSNLTMMIQNKSPLPNKHEVTYQSLDQILSVKRNICIQIKLPWKFSLKKFCSSEPLRYNINAHNMFLNRG